MKKKLARVTTRDYIEVMKHEISSMITDGEPTGEASVVREMPTSPQRETVSVRTAKAHLSGLLERAAAGQEIIIASDGVPKARLVPISQEKRRPFLGTRAHLATMPQWTGGITAEEVIREDRDSRGW